MCLLYIHKTLLFHQNLMKLGEVVLHLHQVLLNSDEKQKRFKLLYKTYLIDRDSPSLRSW